MLLHDIYHSLTIDDLALAFAGVQCLSLIGLSFLDSVYTSRRAC